MAPWESSASAPPASRADQRQADPDTQLTVDLLILDYLLYNATNSVLQQGGRRPGEEDGTASDVDLHISMVDSFLQMFKAFHPGTPPPHDTVVRVQLARFASMYASRSQQTHTGMPSPAALRALRSENRARAQLWLAQSSSPAQLHAARERSDEPGLTLLDLLPSFIRLTAAYAGRSDDWVASETWLALAAQFMQQAALEHAHDASALDEAFAWGPLDPDAMSLDGAASNDASVRENDVFLVTDPDSLTQSYAGDATPPPRSVTAAPWYRVREEAVSALARAGTKRTHAGAHVPRAGGAALDANVLAFLRGLASALETPLLAQLERGTDGSALSVDGERVDAATAARLRRIFHA